MANNYLQFSAVIEQLTVAEAAWCRDRLAHLEQVLREWDGATAPEGVPVEDRGYDPDSGCLGFEYEIGDAGGNLWLYAPESGDVEHVGEFVRELLARFRPEACFTMTWAATCSKMRVDEFSGGALFVTKDAWDTMSAGGWACDQQRAWEARQS